MIRENAPGKLVASSAKKSSRGRRPWPMVAALTASVAMVAAAASGATMPGSDMRFHPTGHWVYNTALQSAFHMDGATTNFDARVPVAGEPGSQVVQDDTNGYVVGRNRITRFGKSNLHVQGTQTAPSDETPLAIEAVGGPYLVYRQSGKIVRLGDKTTVVSVGEPVGDPVVTGDGTLWLLRRQSGLVCTLAKGATATSTCPAKLPAGHSGALTTVADKPQVLDTTAGLLHAVSTQGLGAGNPVGVKVSGATRVAPTDSNGRLALLDPATGRLSFVDTQAKRTPVNVELGKGDFEGPLWTGGTVVVVNRTTGTLQTYDAQGHAKANRKIPPSEGQPSIARGADGRVYVQNGAGTHLLVVDKDGQVADAPVVGSPDPSGSPSPGPSQSSEPRPQPSVQPSVQPSARPPVEPSHEPPNTGRPNPGTGSTHKPSPSHSSLPASAPGAPGSVSAKAGDASATVSWSAAAANRATITNYVVTWSGGSRTVSGSSRRATISGLTNGRGYTFSVYAKNSVGRGPASSADPVTPVSPKKPKIHIERGSSTSSDNCEKPSCAWIDTTLTGFEPNTTYSITAIGNGRDFSEPCTTTTDENGDATCNKTRYDVSGAQVYVYTDTDTYGRITSNTITWE
ncbi:fibronectin type III domain-containing protein [Fodinicola acaciae]|uniref:fibronectin type III domain-containing protein n=1 Tax=Fodinicola acaciae TaxID=2681555 RepID=UPI0013D5F204|nr:fibronectin type III domain-containing protein [Fodinicola acaciae]